MRQSQLQGESASIGFRVKSGIEFLLWALIVPVLAGAGASSLHAQGGFPTYPYCAQYSDGTSLDCSFSTLSMCYQSVTGLGGVCIDNPRASGIALGNPQRPFGLPYAFAPSPVPPPPTQTAGATVAKSPAVTKPTGSAGAGSAVGSAPQPPCNPLYGGTYCASASSNSFAPISSLSSDLIGAAEPPATIGGVTFSSNPDCIGILRRMSCGGT